MTVHCPQNFMPVFLAHLFTYVPVQDIVCECVCKQQLLYCTWSCTTEAPEPVPEAVLVPVVPVHAPELTCQFQLQPRWPRRFGLQSQWPLWFQSELLWPCQFQSQRCWLCQIWSQRQHSRRSRWRCQHQCQDILNSFFKIIFPVLYQWTDKMHSYIHEQIDGKQCTSAYGRASQHGLAVFYSACVSSMLVMLLETQLCWNNNQDLLPQHWPHMLYSVYMKLFVFFSIQQK